ncbi:immunoglobulin domain-containing protein [Citrobacter farmeri]
MSALYEKSQGTKIQITSLPVTPDTVGAATYLDLQCTIKEVQFTGGQKQDIDVTTLCSTEQENINGLGAQSEISMSGNFYSNPAQDALREAYDNDTTYGFRIIFPSGIGFQFLSEVRQHTWSSGTNSVVAATFSLRLKGKPTKIDNVLRLTTDLAETKSVTAGTTLSLTVAAAGGTTPYSYVWKKGGSVVSGQTSATFNKTSAAAGDSGDYVCEVTDSSTPAGKVISETCAVTVA